MKNLKNMAYWAILIASFVLALWVYTTTPQQSVPTHINFKGEVDSYGSKFTSTFLFTLLIGLLGALIAYLEKIEPLRENVRLSKKALRPILLIVSGFMLFSQATFAWLIKTGSNRIDNSVILMGVGVLFILLGNYLPVLKRNFFVGIRVPWTLASDEVWRRTHRLAGRVFIVLGLWLVFSALFRLSFWFWLIPFIAALAYSTLIYPFVIFKKLQSQKEA